MFSLSTISARLLPPTAAANTGRATPTAGVKKGASTPTAAVKARLLTPVAARLLPPTAAANNGGRPSTPTTAIKGASTPTAAVKARLLTPVAARLLPPTAAANNGGRPSTPTTAVKGASTPTAAVKARLLTTVAASWLLPPTAAANTGRDTPTTAVKGGSRSGSGSCHAIKRYSDRSNNNIKLYSGKSSFQLAEKTAAYLGVVLGNIEEELIDNQGLDVYIIQSICFDTDVDLEELATMIHLCRKKLAERITLVIPFFGTDKEEVDKAALTRAVDMISQMGPNRVLMDSASMRPSIGFDYFDLATHIYDGREVLSHYLLLQHALSNVVLVSPWTYHKNDDYLSAMYLHLRLTMINNIPMAFINQDRPGVFDIVGKKHIKGRRAILFQSQISIKSLTDAAMSVTSEGATSIWACAIHARLTPPAAKELSNGIFDAIIVTDASHICESYSSPRLKIISMSPLLAEEISSLHMEA